MTGTKGHDLARSLGRIILLILAAAVAASASDLAEPVERRIERVENGLLPAAISGATPAPPWNIHNRMQRHRVHGASIAVIHNFRLEWARGYGVLQAGSSMPVDTETLFQAASISKPVAAMGMLSLVQQGKLELDEEANRKLISWRIPDNQYTAVRGVTLRHLLTHTAGTTIVGYVGYSPGRQLPTLVQILNGQLPWSNSPPVVVDQVPGTGYRYSGGGYTVMQQLAVDLTGIPFQDWMKTEVLNKLEMSRSTFEQPLPASLALNAASGHYSDGTPIPWKWMIQPELAAAGLWTTPSDLARFVIELQKSFAGTSNRVLSAGMTRQMLMPQAENWGLGIEVQAGGTVFLHSGHNQGYRSIFIGFPHTGDGAVVMTNSDEASDLRMEILRSIATEYGWPLPRVAGIPASAPILASGSAVVNSASNQPVLAPGSVVSMYGPDLGEVSEIVFNGIAGAVLASSPNQVNGVVPRSLSPGPALVQVRRGGVASAGRLVRIDEYSPGIFTLNQSGEGPGLIVHAETFRVVSEAEPARPGGYLSIICTGLGAGDAKPVVTLGGSAARVLWSGPMPGIPGVDQINIEVPADTPGGAAVPVLLRLQGSVSNSVTVAVK